MPDSPPKAALRIRNLRKTYKDVRIVAMNKFQDMALLKVDDKDAPKFKHVVLGSADALEVGQRVFAVGSSAVSGRIR